MKPKLAVILGPTGVGKSAVAIEIAGSVGGEIISGDSQQVYRYMDIGTAKPSPEMRKKVPHHLIDLVDPDQEFNAAMYREKALASAQEIWARGRKVIVSGGTGLYIRVLLHGIFVGPPRNAEIRARLEQEANNGGLDRLYERLRLQDPGVTSRIHPNDAQRIIRALEVFELTGKPIGQWQKEHRFADAPFDVLKIGLHRERKELYGLIDRRCEEMMARGLIEEVRGLMARGYSLDLSPLQSVGYRHAGLCLQGRLSPAEALSLMQRDTRHLAKRQLTWFRSDKEIRWLHPERQRGEIVRAVKEFFDEG